MDARAQAIARIRRAIDQNLAGLPAQRSDAPDGFRWLYDLVAHAHEDLDTLEERQHENDPDC